MTPQNATAIANFLLDEFEREAQTTVSILAAVPADRSDYRPDSKSKCGLGLVRHIVLEDEWMLNSIVAGAFTPPPDDSDACGILTPADGVGRYQQSIPAALARVRALPAEDLTRIIDMFGLFQLPAVNFLSLALKHSIHHRGQLSSYLRAMGGSVPSIYGPTADLNVAAASAN